MYLYNVILGNQQIAPEKWSHIVDDYGNHFLAKDDIHQRLRIDRAVDPDIYPDMGELEPLWGSSNIQCYHALDGTKWVNNNKNMNPLILENRKRMEEGNDDGEQIVIYLITASNYSILRFNTPHRILQTFHKKDTVQGCAIVLSEKERNENPEFIDVKLYDNKKNLYLDVRLVAFEKEPEKIMIEKKQIKDQKSLTKFKEQVNKYKNRFMGFKIVSKPGEFLTNTYFVNDDEELKNKVAEATKNIRNRELYSVDASKLDTDPEYLASFEEDMKLAISENRIRAITLCDVNLPVDMIRRMRLLYVFNYNPEINRLFCRKSN